jgi:hypothetical protein
VERKLELLSYLAVKKFEQPQYVLFEQAEIEGYIAEFLGIGQRDSRVVLKAIEAQHGLLIERSQKIWSFSHLTFQEYLVAKPFVESADWQKLARYVAEEQWRSVFLLGIEMAEAEAANLLHEMKRSIDSLVAGDEGIQEFLTWITGEALSVEVPTWYDRTAIRAIYFDIARGKVYAAYSTHEDAMLRQIFSLAWVIDPELGTDLELAIEIGRSRHLYRLHNLVQDIELSSCQIEHHWQFNNQQEELLQKYYTANKLFMDCLKSDCKISDSIKEKVKKMVLLPIAEIEKHKRKKLE